MLKTSLNMISEYGNSNRIGIITIMFLFILVVSFLKPHPDLLSLWLATFGGDIIILATSFFLVIMLPSFRFRPSFLKIFIFQIVAVCLLVTALYLSGLFVSYSETLDGLTDIVRISYYLLFFFIVNQAFSIKLIDLKSVLKLIDFTFIINVIVVLCQLFDPPILGDFTQIIFGSVKLRSIFSGYPRVYGTYFNANWFGVYLVFLITWWISLTKNAKKNLKRKFSLRILVATILILLSGSRTAGVGLFCAVTFLSFIQKRIKLFSFILILLILLYLTTLIIFTTNSMLSRTLLRFFMLRDAIAQRDLMTIRSFEARTNTWSEAFELLRNRKNAWVVGLGGYSVTDNTFVRIMAVYGIIGIFALVLFFVPAFVIVSKKIRLNVFAECFYAFSFSLLVMMITAEFFFTTQIMSIWILLLSITLNFSTEDFANI
ncbi:MAG: hypothetical protein PWQ70_2983 [Clostridiales bacterium]|nr:hypothetical protein [Clostridiales bacterium]